MGEGCRSGPGGVRQPPTIFSYEMAYRVFVPYLLEFTQRQRGLLLLLLLLRGGHRDLCSGHVVQERWT